MNKYVSTSLFLVCLSAVAAAQGKDEPSQPKGNPPGHYGPPPGTSFTALIGGSNDCSTASTNDAITGTGTFAVNTVGATTGVTPQTPSTIKNDVWFYWTAAATGLAKLETCGGVTVDTKAAAWAANNGTACPSGLSLAYNDDACGLQTRITWQVTAGTSYFLQLGAFTEGVTYSGTFTLDVLIPPANDVCSAPTAISGVGPFNFDTVVATTGTQGQAESLCGANTAIGRDIWYAWTASSTGTVAVSTCGSTTLDTKIAVYPAGGCPVTGTALACNDDAPCGAQSIAIFNCTSGTTYLIQLGQDPTNTTGGGSGTFSVSDATPPTNDSCATPIAISGGGTFPFDNRWATTGVEGQAEPLCLAFSTTAIAKDSWWSWTPSQSGLVTVSTCGQVLGGTDTRIAVYGGAGCPAGAAIACNDDAAAPACAAQALASTLTFTAVCGQAYTIQVGNYSVTASLYGTFSVTETPGTPCAPPATPVCLGDGTGAACPCANNGTAGNGCGSSVNAAGGNLTSSGAASIAGDTLVLTGTGMPNSSALYFQGTSALGSGLGVSFGDGLRCAGGSVIRLGTKANSAGASQYPAVGDISVSVRGLNSAGAARVYQVWYRNAAAFCTPSTFNLTNGLSLTWTP
ncbi:MAG: hypothetical protein NTY35_07370 [Planctomycetota bacterium]|nr:hypothetical protein [Planctomycetota bacterium]